MLAEPITNLHLFVPDRLKKIDEVIFSRGLPTSLHNQSPISKVFYPQGVQSF
jgi:hypothetical protein